MTSFTTPACTIMTTRACYAIVSSLMDFKENRAHGPLAPLGEVLLEMFHGMNYTLIMESSKGVIIDKSTMRYNGCIGSLQANESDTLLFPANLPIIAENISTATVYSYDKIGMLSAYEKPDISVNSIGTHVLDMVFGFSWLSWSVLIGLLIVIFAVQIQAMNPKRKKKRKNFSSKFCLRSYRIIVGCALAQHSSIGSRVRKSFTSRLLYTCATLLTFYSCYFLTSMIKTDMVVIKPPVTIESYDELIESDRRPLWLKVYDDYTYFQNAAGGSKEKRIWEKAEEKGINQSIVPVSMAHLIPRAMAIGENTEVFMLNRLIGSKSLVHACAVSRTQGLKVNMYPIFRFDASAKEILRGTFQNHLIPDMVSNVIHRNTQRIFQSQLMEASSRFFDLGNLITDREKMYSAIHECSCNIILIPTPEHKAVDLRHYLSLFVLVVCLIAVCHISLLYERKRLKKSEGRKAPKRIRGLRPLRVSSIEMP